MHDQGLISTCTQISVTTWHLDAVYILTAYNQNCVKSIPNSFCTFIDVLQPVTKSSKE